MTSADSGLQVHAVLFDAFPIFDPTPVFSMAEEFPGRGSELSDSWRNRRFEYAWLRSLGHRYQDFWQIGESALVFAGERMKLDLTPEKRHRLMGG